MRTTSIALAILFGAACAAPAVPQPPGQPDDTRQVTVHIHDATVAEAAAALSQASGASITLAPGVDAGQRVSLSLKHTSVSSVVAQLAREAGLEAVREPSGAYVLEAPSSMTAPSPSPSAPGAASTQLNATTFIVTAPSVDATGKPGVRITAYRQSNGRTVAISTLFETNSGEIEP
ncbi:MAG: STN domain-containing protein [Capsulimonadaceae bacterium]